MIKKRYYRTKYSHIMTISISSILSWGISSLLISHNIQIAYGLGDYCTFEPDFNCYFAGVPTCCEFGQETCPAEQPSCEIEPPIGGLECPNIFDIDAWTDVELNDERLSFRYAIVLSASGSPEDSIMCGQLKSDLEGDTLGWMGFGISPEGMCFLIGGIVSNVCAYLMRLLIISSPLKNIFCNLTMFAHHRRHGRKPRYNWQPSR